MIDPMLIALASILSILMSLTLLRREDPSRINRR